MDDRNVYPRISALLDDYLQPLGMLQARGPLRALRELTSGIIFTGSVQLSNAARLWVGNPHQLRHAVERLSDHLANPHWDHREWAAAVLRLQAEAIDEDDLIPIDPTELAKPYARHMQYQCTIRDASRVDDPLVQGYWCFGAYHWQPDPSSLSALMLRPYSRNQPGFRSENALFGRWFWTLREATSGRGIWLLDRGGDRRGTERGIGWVRSGFLKREPSLGVPVDPPIAGRLDFQALILAGIRIIRSGFASMATKPGWAFLRRCR